MQINTSRKALRILAHARINRFFEASFLRQFMFFGAAYLGVNAAFIAIALCQPQVDHLAPIPRLWWALHRVMPGLEGALSLDDATRRSLRAIEINPLLPFFATLLSWVDGVIWQAFFIAKLFYNRHDIEFSNAIAFYSPEQLRSEGNTQMRYGALVFKLFSKNSAPLFDFRVRAVLKHLDDRSDNPTYQHFALRVPDQDIPLLEPMMPFRIYIDLGPVNAAVYQREFLFSARHAQHGGHLDPISIEAIGERVAQGQSLPGDNEIIVYVEAKDGNDGRTKIDYHRYPIASIAQAEFESIEPANGRFELDEILRKMDRLHIEQASRDPVTATQSSGAN